MIDGKTIALVLPCFNEENGIVEMAYMMPDCIDEVVVVDNNSTDRTVAFARQLGWTVVREHRQGYGAALKRGFAYAKQDIIVAMDADASYPLDEVERCVGYLLDKNLDFLSCSRFPLKDKNSMRPLNYVGNRFLTMVANELFGLELHDITTGMWIMKRWVLPACLYCSDDFRFCVEWKLWAAVFLDFCRFGEIPISYRSRVGKVKQHRWRDGFRYLWTMLKMRCGK